MLSEFATAHAQPLVAVITLLVFVAMFTVLVVRVLSRSARPRYDALARLPLEDETDHAAPAASTVQGELHG
jgi:cbb3-type cytochrome oxidase subunit 3